MLGLERWSRLVALVALAEIMLAQRLASDPDRLGDPGLDPAVRQQEPDFIAISLDRNVWGVLSL